MTEKCEPAKSIIEKLGGAAEVHRALGIAISTVCAWESPDAGKGRIPVKYWGKLKVFAKSKQIRLTISHFTGTVAIK